MGEMEGGRGKGGKEEVRDGEREGRGKEGRRRGEMERGRGEGGKEKGREGGKEGRDVGKSMLLYMHISSKLIYIHLLTYYNVCIMVRTLYMYIVHTSNCKQSDSS